MIPLLMGMVLVLAPVAAAAQPLQAQFRTWLESEIWPEASKARISRGTFDAALASVQVNLKLPDLVIPGAKSDQPRKQHQAEFRSPAAYFAEKNLTPVIAGGRTR